MENQPRESNGGRVETIPNVPLRNMNDLSEYYTPGVARLCLKIKEDREKVFEHTGKGNTIAIVSDGTRILGLGNIGPEAGLPVMEGKAILFKKFGGINAVPLCIGTTDEDKIVEFVRNIAPTFGAVNLEDIESPKAFRIFDKLQGLSIPVFHDDRHGTAVVTVGALINAVKLVGKDRKARIVINGAGVAGIGTASLALASGFSNVTLVDSKGAIYEGRKEDMNKFKEEIAAKTNKDNTRGGIEEVASGADVLIGLSRKGAFPDKIIGGMANKPIVFALANPEPEIGYEQAKDAGAFIVATGASNKPNQVNNVVAFPGIMRGILDSRALGITEGMLSAAAEALAAGTGKNLSAEHILPYVFDSRYGEVSAGIAVAVAGTAVKEGIARMKPSPDEIRKNMESLLLRYNKLEEFRFGR